MPNINSAESNATPVAVMNLTLYLRSAETNAGQLDASLIGTLVPSSVVQLWSVQVHGIAREVLVPHDNGGVTK